jgi:hypothetical protein
MAFAFLVSTKNDQTHHTGQWSTANGIEMTADWSEFAFPVRRG